MRRINILTAVSLCLATLPALAGTMTCNSSNGQFQTCGLSHADQRNISVQNIKSGSCVLDDTWGVNSESIWVQGCSAVFTYSDTGNSSYSNYYSGPDVDIWLAPAFWYGAGWYGGYYFNNENSYYNYYNHHYYDHSHNGHNNGGHNNGGHNHNNNGGHNHNNNNGGHNNGGHNHNNGSHNNGGHSSGGSHGSNKSAKAHTSAASHKSGGSHGGGGGHGHK